MTNQTNQNASRSEPANKNAGSRRHESEINSGKKNAETRSPSNPNEAGRKSDQQASHSPSRNEQQ